MVLIKGMSLPSTYNYCILCNQILIVQLGRSKNDDYLDLDADVTIKGTLYQKDSLNKEI